MSNKPHLETTLDDYKAYAYHIREDAKSRGVENTRLSIYGIYMAVVEKQDAELEQINDKLHQMTHNCVGAEMELEQVTEERDSYKRIIDDVRAGNYNNAHDSLAARKFIYEQLAAMKGGKG